MIKVQNLEKYFNKRQNNEIHVINDINLTLPSKGLVVLLGPSGSGKSTLLNVLGGLDKVHSGSIDFDGTEISKYNANTWDKIRNESIGYIFQNYNLLHNQTVYDNIALTLHMSGIIEKEEIDKRVDYLLDNMGMINYRRRKAAQLSGGQQQRVAIARALAKNPKVIIADEPTGNLDSKNTYDIMNILRNISQNKLVVLVTHEENIANLYADRIIRLRDGQIVEDKENKSIGGMDVQLETDIYLKDLKQITDYKSDESILNVYSDEEVESNFDVRLIVKNKTLYVEVKSDKYTRINLLEKDSEVKVFNEHYKGQEIEEFTETDFDLGKIVDDSNKIIGKPVISFKEAVRLAFNRLRDSSKFGKLIYVMYFLNAAIVGIAIALISNAYSVNPHDFMKEPLDTISIQVANPEYDDIMEYEDQASIGYLNLVPNISTKLVLPKVFQARDTQAQHSYLPVYAEYMDSSELILGRAVEDQNEVVLNKRYVESLLAFGQFESLGISTIEDFINLEMTYDLIGFGGKLSTVSVAIVGIVESDDPVFYAKEETLWQMYTHYAVYELYEDDIIVTDGTVTDTYEQFLIKDNVDILPVISLNKIDLNGTDLYSMAVYTSTEATTPDYLIPLNTLKEIYFPTGDGTSKVSLSFYAENIDEADAFFKGLTITPSKVYEEMAKEYQVSKIIDSVGYIMFAAVFLGASSIASFFIMRSSLLSRIYEISVYRALGAPKRDLRKIFLIESLILTTFTSLLGYIAMSYVLLKLQVATEGFFEVVKISPLTFVVGIVIIYATNIFSGIWPVSNLLRRTPAEIISKYDF